MSVDYVANPDDCSQRVPFGFRDGRLWDIADVERGAKCACICSACRQPLVAKKGEVLRHHFAHAPGCNCSTGLETSVHQMAKQILVETKTVMLPGLGEIHSLQKDARWAKIPYPPISKSGWLFPPEKKHFENARPEVSVRDEATGELLRPDVTCDSDRFWIEIRVTHKVDKEKAMKISRKGIECLEIDLRPFIRDWLRSVNQKDATPVATKLAEFITSSTERRVWIADRRVEEWFRQNVVLDEVQLGLVDDNWGKSRKQAGPRFW